MDAALLVDLAITFHDFVNTPQFSPFFLFGMIIGIMGTVGCIGPVNGGVISFDGAVPEVTDGDCSPGTGVVCATYLCLSCTSSWLVPNGGVPSCLFMVDTWCCSNLHVRRKCM